MATYTHPVTGEEFEYIPYAELDDEAREWVDSSDWRDRSDAAWEMLGLDWLVVDADRDVRASVAKQGFGLEKLVDDADGWVRRAVAGQGFGLDALAGDARDDVKEAVRKRLALERTTLAAWIEANPDKCALPENRVVSGDRHAPKLPAYSYLLYDWAEMQLKGDTSLTGHSNIRELLEKIVWFGRKNHSSSLDGFAYFLADILPDWMDTGKIACFINPEDLTKDLFEIREQGYSAAREELSARYVLDSEGDEVARAANKLVVESYERYALNPRACEDPER